MCALIITLNKDCQLKSNRGDFLLLQVKAHQGQVDNSVKQIEKQLKKTVVALQEAAGPDATAKAEDIKTKLNEGFKNTVDQVHKLTEAAQPHIDGIQKT